ncbi:hypothetical protein BpHYR1_000990 [Brachionus plicatilis]|uniref:Uncharacterized protein n=1 Tax=Brachionus plicatilis TaxID=10195 RepID=A0A3M7RQ67_BRAPC|nr:hypothetical protein BpHYR1_000990 [Brachionus plicatilis]
MTLLIFIYLLTFLISSNSPKYPCHQDFLNIRTNVSTLISQKINFTKKKSLRLVWYTRAMAAISTSQETLNVVKKALSKHANPVLSSKQSLAMKYYYYYYYYLGHKICEHKVHILSKILMVTFFVKKRIKLNESVDVHTLNVENSTNVKLLFVEVAEELIDLIILSTKN